MSIEIPFERHERGVSQSGSISLEDYVEALRFAGMPFKGLDLLSVVLQDEGGLRALEQDISLLSRIDPTLWPGDEEDVARSFREVRERLERNYDEAIEQLQDEINVILQQHRDIILIGHDKLRVMRAHVLGGSIRRARIALEDDRQLLHEGVPLFVDVAKLGQDEVGAVEEYYNPVEQPLE